MTFSEILQPKLRRTTSNFKNDDFIIKAKKCQFDRVPGHSLQALLLRLFPLENMYFVISRNY